MPSKIAKKKEPQQVDDLWTRLQVLRETTSMVGVVHEAQIEQLKLWGRLAFQHVPKGNIEILVNADKKSVTYKLSAGKLDVVKTQAMLVAGLDRSVHALLGNDWHLDIDFKNKKVYEGLVVKTEAEIKDERRDARSTRIGRKSTK